MSFRNPVTIRNTDAVDRTVIVEPWAVEYVLAPGEECQVVLTNPECMPTFQMDLVSDRVVLWVEEAGSLFEVWKARVRID